MVEEVLARQRYLLMSGATERGPAGRRTSSKASNSPLVRSGRIAGDAHVYDDWVPHPLPSDFPWFTPMWDPQARLLRIEHGWGMEVAYVNMRAHGDLAERSQPAPRAWSPSLRGGPFVRDRDVLG